jgi:serine/threonine-protein kinase HipA
LSSKLNVFWENDRVGTLSLGPDRQFIFQYLDEWLAKPDRLPLSLSLPLRKAPFPDNAAHPFFSNLLPESRVKELIAQRLGVSSRNDFSLLEALGGDCAGALSLLPAGQRPDSAGGYAPLSHAELEEIIRQTPQRPLLSPGEGIRLSLAGAQDKLPIYLEDGTFFLPKGANPSSHILKPSIPGFDNSVENEVFCMRLAQALGLPVPSVQIWNAPTPLFLIERYDRKRDPSGILHRIHQEDVCQALGTGYDQKYESEGGPSLKDCFGVIDRSCREPVLDKRRLLQWTLFNTLIGNNDAHGKNVSLLIKKEGIRLAPFYDLLSTAVYPEISQKLAMTIGGENRAEWLRKDHWEKLAKDASVSPKAIIRLAKEMREATPAALDAVKNEVTQSAGDHGIVEKVASHIEQMSRHFKATFQ